MESLVTKLVDKTVGSLGRRVRYLRDYNPNIADLRNKLKVLEESREAVERRVNIAKQRGNVIIPEVEQWLARVDIKIKEFDELLHSEEFEENRFIDLKSRYKVSKKAKEGILLLGRLQYEGKFKQVYDPALQPAPTYDFTLRRDLGVFESRRPTYEAIIKALQGDEISIIGVYGMAGVGKTKLVREIAKYAKFNHLFDEIVMAVVSQTPNIRKIQGEIADLLGLQFDVESENDRADRLYARIKNVKRILVILDDLWTALDLEAVGIPHGDAHEGCKIVLISRELDVCHQMNAQTSNCIQVLSESEAWALFKKTAGNIEELPDVLPVAREVAKECGGLPFAIISVAQALRGKNDIVWKDALHKLKKVEGLHDPIYRFLDLSFELLETEELKTYDFTLRRDLGVVESRRPTYEAIIKALQGDEISIIGVYGMAGVGKTKLVREIAKYAKFNHLFDEIVMAVVSQTPNIRKIQGEIADLLGLQFDVESDYDRAGRLYARIKNVKRILVILDDLWTALDLEAVGIPHGDAHEGCKIVLISRELDVCHQMNAQTSNCIQVLSESEAWALFKKAAGNIEELPDVLPVAREVAKECGGLPFAIISVAQALRGKNDIVWKDALHKLKKVEGLHDPIYRFLDLSFELLETEELKTYDFTLRTGLGVFESRRPTYEAVIKALQGAEISIIGVHGMAGVGKTTLVREIARYAEFNHLFHEIVMAVVSPKPNIRKIQGEIADALGLQFDVESDYGRAGRLYARIKNVKRILVILDDLQTALDLEAIGIPHGDAHEGCKIVLTSRELDVCQQMNAQISNCIQVLSESEAWTLFKKTAGNIEKWPDVLPVAREVAKECGGLPVAIISVAKALRGKHDIVWKDALHKLKNVKGLPDPIYRSLELSFKLLETEELKTCFLLCSLFPEDSNIPIENLVRYGIGLRWYRNVDSLIEARFRVHTIIDELKACGLLLDGIDKGSTRMHDVVREFAISMASGGEHAFLVRAGSGEAEWPKVEALSQYRVISLIGNCIQKFPRYGLHCPNLEMLVLQCDSDSVEMPHNFFKGMKKLGVLHLRRMSIPYSIGHLKKLRMLCLECCKIPDDLREMGELENLEILSIVDCDIEELPRAIGKLFNLRLLDLANCKKLRVIRPGILVRLTDLEGLYMRNSFKDWAGYGQEDNASLTELKDLSSLEVLEMHIPDAKLYPKDLLFDTLTQFKITIGGDFDGHDIYSYSKNLKLENCGSVAGEGGGVNMLLKKAESVVLKDLKIEQNVIFDLTHHDFGNLKVVVVFDCDKLKSLFRHIRGRGLGQLHGLDVRSCSNMEAILAEDGGAVAQEDEIVFPELKSMKLMSLPNLMSFLDARLHEPLFHRKVLFPALEELYLWGLDNMEEIWHRQLLPAQSFYSLSDLSIGSCGKLVTVIPSNLSGRLNILAKFSVWDCDSVEEICEGHDATSLILPQISILRLWGLPKLEHIWWNKVSHSFISLKNIKILRIYRCKVLRFVFSVSTLKDLGQLEILAIGKCDMMKAIVADEGQDTIEAVNRIVFPKLHTLELKYMEQLTGFYQGDCTLVFDSLEILRVEKCPLINTDRENPKEGSAPPQPFGGEQRLIAPKLHNIKLGGLTELQKSLLHSTAQHSTKEGKPVGGEGKEKEGKVTAPQFHSEIVEDKA